MAFMLQNVARHIPSDKEKTDYFIFSGKQVDLKKMTELAENGHSGFFC
jgi:hypothetical protein